MSPTRSPQQTDRALWIVVAFVLLLGGCNDKGVDGGEPPRVIPYVEYLSTSHVDDYVYFIFGGDTTYAKGLWRYNLNGQEPPQLIAPGAFNGAVSPCGNAVAYNSYGHLWLVRLPAGEPLSGTPELLLDAVNDGGVTDVNWRDCNHVLFSPNATSGIVELDLETRAIDTLLDYGRLATASADGAVIAFIDRQNVFVLEDGMIDSLTAFAAKEGASDPHISANGREIVYSHLWPTDTTRHTSYNLDIEVIDVKTRARRTVALLGKFPTWTRHDSILYQNADTLHLREIWITDSDGHAHRPVLTYDTFLEWLQTE
ncbi:MAG: hypothetical protein GF341_08805 [candidate division Zixibacteria bacterium]|nr:hypothetical protein [candidate division Zixibacteria bacterium]